MFWYVGSLITSLVYNANKLEVFPDIKIEAALLMGSYQQILIISKNFQKKTRYVVQF